MSIKEIITSSKQKFQFLSAGGEMGALMRGKQWSATSIGDPAVWPQSLRTTISIILNSKFPMFLFWGAELTCFYNDAYRPSLGQDGKHPDILGMRGEDAWPEIWSIIKPLIDQVLAGGEASWSEDQLIPIYRNNKLEDVFWTFSYSPVFDETGKPAGVFVTCSETTEKVNNIKKLEESNDQLAFAIEAAEMGTYDYNPLTNKFTANERLKDWFGLQPKDEIELQHATDAIAENDRQRVINAIQKSLEFSSGGKYDVEYTIVHPFTGKKTIVRAKGKASFDKNGVAYRLNGTLQDITERKQEEEKLTTTTKHLQLALMAGKLGSYKLDINTGDIDCTPQCKENFNISANESFTFSQLKDCIIDEDRPVMEALVQNALINNTTYDTEYRIRWKDETIHWIHAAGIPIYNNAGKAIAMSGVTEDITVEKQQQIQLKESEQLYKDAEERLRLALEAANLATWELDLKNHHIVYTPRLAEIFGFKGTEMLHQQMRDKLHPYDRVNVVEKAFEAAMQTGIYSYESRVMQDDGTVTWISTQGKISYDDEHKPVKIVGTLRDITDEKQYQQELEEREEKFRLLADSMPQLIWTGDKYGNIDYFNQAVYTYSGLSPIEIQTKGWLEIVHPDERQENIRLWMESVQTGRHFVFEHRFRRSDGEYRWQLSRAIPQRDSSGAIQMWVGSSTDIHELKKQEEEKDFFISIASHELKTPITSIKAYIQLLMDKYSNSQDLFLEKSLSNVDRQIVKLTTLISDLLDLSKIKSGKLYLQKEKFDLNELIVEVINEISYINPRYNVAFSKGTDINLYGDRERIGQVLTNFLTNAIKYSPKVTDIKVTSVKDNHKIILSVEDSGIGINKNDQEKIFNRFYRVEGKSEKTFPGFGIGLFICQEIIHRHDGKIGVISEPGKGSVFYFTLPLEDDQVT